MSSLHLSDEILMAFADGELDDAMAVAVEQAMRDYEAGRDPLITAADYQRLQEVWADTTAQAVGSPEVGVWSVDQPTGYPGSAGQVPPTGID